MVHDGNSLTSVSLTAHLGHVVDETLPRRQRRKETNNVSGECVERSAYLECSSSAERGALGVLVIALEKALVGTLYGATCALT
jgi:hypothetical protein